MFTLSVSEEFTGTRNARDPPPPFIPRAKYRANWRVNAFAESADAEPIEFIYQAPSLEAGRQDVELPIPYIANLRFLPRERLGISPLVLFSLSLSLSLFLISLGVAETVLELDIYYIRHSVFRLETSFFPRGPMR